MYVMAIQSAGEYANIESLNKIEILHSYALENISKRHRGGGKHKQCTSYA
jgi:hypothetical protein